MKKPIDMNLVQLKAENIELKTEIESLKAQIEKMKWHKLDWDKAEENPDVDKLVKVVIILSVICFILFFRFIVLHCIYLLFT